MLIASLKIIKNKQRVFFFLLRVLSSAAVEKFEADEGEIYDNSKFSFISFLELENATCRRDCVIKTGELRLPGIVCDVNFLVIVKTSLSEY